MGVIIIKIICGPEGYSLVDDMTQEEFVDLGLCCCQHSVLHLILFMHQFVAGQGHPNRTEEYLIDTSNPFGFGQTLVDDHIITSTPEPNGSIVARAQGFLMQAGQTVDNQWYTAFNMVFEDQRFAGSTLQVMGTTTRKNGEWSIVGGTGLFRRAKGTIEFINNIPESTGHDAIKKLEIEVFYTRKSS